MAVSKISRVPKLTQETVLYSEDNWNISYVKSGDTVTVYVLRPASTTVDATLATLPTGFRPMHDIGIRAYYGDAFCEVKANGGIRVKSEAQWIQFCTTFVVG